MAVERLGCATTYRVAVNHRGGGYLHTWLPGITALSWGRKRDDFSEARVTIAKTLAGVDCCGRLGTTHTWGHELSIYRDEDPAPVWQGPIIRKTEKRATFELEARDMLAWLDRRSTPFGLAQHQPADTGRILRDVIIGGFAWGDDWLNPGLIEYATLDDTGTQSTTETIYTDTKTIGDLARDLIGAGVDLYTIGRRVALHSDKTTASPYRLSDTDFLDELEIRENGLDACTRAILVGGQPLDGEGHPIQDVPPVMGIAELPAGHPNRAFYGRVDRISTSTNTVVPGVAQGIAQAMLGYGHPAPVDIVVPQGARLSPQAPVALGQLIPGRPFVVDLSAAYCTPVEQAFRLNEVEVTWTDREVEEVAVSLASNGPAIERPTP